MTVDAKQIISDATDRALDTTPSVLSLAVALGVPAKKLAEVHADREGAVADYLAEFTAEYVKAAMKKKRDDEKEKKEKKA